MKKTLLYTVFTGILLLNTGCVSYMAKQNWNEAQKVNAVRVEADGQQVMVGLDLTKLTYLKDNWPVAVGAGILDAGLAYGAYYVLDDLTSSSSDSGSRQSTGRDASNVSISGDGNTVQIRGDQSNFGGE